MSYFRSPVYVDKISHLKYIEKSTGTVAIVSEDGVGGTFVYDSNQFSVNDGGIIFNGWVRQYNDSSVKLKWFGNPDNNDTWVKASALNKPVEVDSGIYNTITDIAGVDTSLFFSSGSISLPNVTLTSNLSDTTRIPLKLEHTEQAGTPDVDTARLGDTTTDTDADKIYKCATIDGTKSWVQIN